MVKVIFCSLILLFSLTSKAQTEELKVVHYIIRDLKMLNMISESMKSLDMDSLLAIGYLPVLHSRSLCNCKRISVHDTLVRACIKYTLNLKYVTSDIIFSDGKVAMTTVDGIDIVLILQDFSGLIFVPFPSKLLVNSAKADFENYSDGVVLFEVVYDGIKYIGYDY